jgi:hypothetical protein
MTTFTITIDDAAQLLGIAFVREEYNAKLSLTEGQELEDHPNYIADDQAYIQFVMSSAASSYANTRATELLRRQLEAA